MITISPLNNYFIDLPHAWCALVPPGLLTLKKKAMEYVLETKKATKDGFKLEQKFKKQIDSGLERLRTDGRIFKKFTRTNGDDLTESEIESEELLLKKKSVIDMAGSHIKSVKYYLCMRQ